MVPEISYPVRGKTYTLFGDSVSTEGFYRQIGSIIDQITERENMTEAQLLEYIQQNSEKRKKLKGMSQNTGSSSQLSRIVGLLHDRLKDYMTGIEDHLESIPFYKRFTDRGLFTNREQYYLYMIEFELVNRLHIRQFLDADIRIALLPYCLKESQDECRAETDAIDYQCRGCLKNCYINQVNRLLKKHNIVPYIWRNIKLSDLFRKLSQEHGSVGILGIACLVELVSGMHRCMKAHIPVVGIPLNANRCPRWMNSLHETTVDVSALERLIT